MSSAIAATNSGLTCASPPQPYSALPYGTDVLHFVVIMAGLSYPAGCFLGMLFEDKSLRTINIMTGVGTLLGCYMTVCALMSPSPPLVNHTLGGVIIVVCWISMVGILSYAKTMITLVICDYNSTKGMFWVGMNTQFGAALGASIIFVLINYTALFNEC